MDQTFALIVDDDEDDRYFIRRALEKHIRRISIKEAKNGYEALDYLLSKEKARDFDVVVLDINMPLLNGIETLRLIRANESLKYIPVVILSTSDSSEYVKKAYQEGANSYIKKPIGMTKYDDIAKAIDCCFLSVEHRTSLRSDS